MRTYPDPKDPDTIQELGKFNAQNWQIEVLKLNPNYTSWGVYEDYMSKTGTGWDCANIFQTWEDFGPWNLDIYNQVANYYFETVQPSHWCKTCAGTGLNPATKKLSDDWYDFDKTGERWCEEIEEAEILALAQAGRLAKLISGYQYDCDTNTWFQVVSGQKITVNQPKMPSPDEVNRYFQIGIGHDSINQWICVKARAKSLGVYGACLLCDDGRVFESVPAVTSLQLWFLHPRKGSSRGVLVEKIQESELETIFDYLTLAATHNAHRFSKLTNRLERSDLSDPT